MQDPVDYLYIAGGLAACAFTLTCCAIHWDDPPDWCPEFWQPSWKRYKEKDSPKTNDNTCDSTIGVAGNSNKYGIKAVVVSVAEPTEKTSIINSKTKDKNASSNKEWEMV